MLNCMRVANFHTAPKRHLIKNFYQENRFLFVKI